MVMSNSTEKSKLNFDDIWDLILAKDVCYRDFGTISSLGLALNFYTQGGGHNGSKARKQEQEQVQAWVAGSLLELCQDKPIKWDYRNLKTKDDTVNVVAEEIQDALSLPFQRDGWIWGALFASEENAR